MSRRHVLAALSVLAVLCFASLAGAEEEVLDKVPPEQREAVGKLLQRPDGLACPHSNIFRTPEQVIADRMAAIEAGDLDGVMCTYAPDAVVIMPSGPISGLANIRGAFAAMMGMIQGAPPLSTLHVVGEVVMTTFSYYGPFFSIPDGSDTYVIRWGYIRAQTVHNTLVFGPPPAP